MFAALVIFALTSISSLSVSFWRKKIQGFKEMENSNLGPCACTTSSHNTLMWLNLKPGSVCLSFCLLSQNGAIAVSCSQAGLARFKASPVTSGTSTHYTRLCHVWYAQCNIRFLNALIKTAKYHLVLHHNEVEAWALCCTVCCTVQVLYIRDKTFWCYKE